MEGPEDRAFLLAGAEMMGIDLEQDGVAVLPTEGKTNLDKPFIIFRQLGIPTYLLFDADVGKDDPKTGTNQLLLRLLGEDPVEFPETTVGDIWACFRTDFRDIVAEETGSDPFARALTEVCEELGFPGEETRKTKNAAVLTQVMRRLNGRGHNSPLLEDILSRISSLGE